MTPPITCITWRQYLSHSQRVAHTSCRNGGWCTLCPLCSGLSDLCVALFPVFERSTPLFPITFLQPQQFHAITHSFAQRRAAIPPIFNGFRTLSIATGVYYPNVPFRNSPPQFLGGKSHVLRDLQPLRRPSSKLM